MKLRIRHTYNYTVLGTIEVTEKERNAIVNTWRASSPRDRNAYMYFVDKTEVAGNECTMHAFKAEAAVYKEDTWAPPELCLLVPSLEEALDIRRMEAHQLPLFGWSQND